MTPVLMQWRRYCFRLHILRESLNWCVFFIKVILHWFSQVFVAQFAVGVTVLFLIVVGGVYLTKNSTSTQARRRQHNVGAVVLVFFNCSLFSLFSTLQLKLGSIISPVLCTSKVLGTRELRWYSFLITIVVSIVAWLLALSIHSRCTVPCFVLKLLWKTNAFYSKAKFFVCAPTSAKDIMRIEWHCAEETITA